MATSRGRSARADASDSDSDAPAAPVSPTNPLSPTAVVYDDAFSASIPPAVQLEHDLQMATLRHRKEARELRSKARRREKEARAAAEQLDAARRENAALAQQLEAARAQLLQTEAAHRALQKSEAKQLHQLASARAQAEATKLTHEAAVASVREQLQRVQDGQAAKDQEVAIARASEDAHARERQRLERRAEEAERGAAMARAELDVMRNEERAATRAKEQLQERGLAFERDRERLETAAARAAEAALEKEAALRDLTARLAAAAAQGEDARRGSDEWRERCRAAEALAEERHVAQRGLEAEVASARGQLARRADEALERQQAHDAAEAAARAAGAGRRRLGYSYAALGLQAKVSRAYFLWVGAAHAIGAAAARGSELAHAAAAAERLDYAEAEGVRRRQLAALSAGALGAAAAGGLRASAGFLFGWWARRTARHLLVRSRWQALVRRAEARILSQFYSDPPSWRYRLRVRKRREEARYATGYWRLKRTTVPAARAIFVAWKLWAASAALYAEASYLEAMRTSLHSTAGSWWDAVDESPKEAPSPPRTSRARAYDHMRTDVEGTLRDGSPIVYV